jgi:hypothetical protein
MAMIKTAEGLVAHVKKAAAEKWGYVYGTFGLVLTPTRLQEKLRQYPAQTLKYEAFIRNNWLGERTADCVGLIKSYLWWDFGEPRYDNETDFSANKASAAAKRSGAISSIPSEPGICVWKEGHIGVYIGDQMVVEAHGTESGVIVTPLKGPGATKWSRWIEYPGIAYVPAEVKTDDPFMLAKLLFDQGLILDQPLWAEVLLGRKELNPAWGRQLARNMLNKLAQK